MLLSSKQDSVSIAQTSTCYLLTTGEIHDGDIVNIVSPIFTSINYSSGAINLSEELEVPCKISNDAKMITYDGKNGYTGTLKCYDNDVFNMYVQL